MRTDEEYSRVNFDVVEIRRIQSLVEPYQLGWEAHIRISNLSTLSHVVQAFLETYFLREHHVTEDHGRRSWDTLHTVDVDTAVFSLGFLDEIYYLVKAAFNVLSNVILQVKWEVFDSFIYVIIRGVVSGTVDDMRDTIAFKFVQVFRNNITS